MTYGTLKHQHSSLQFNDPERQQRHDVKTIFERGKGFPVKSGTESGDDNALFDLIEEFSKKFNHFLSVRQGNWVAVDRDIIKPNTSRRDHIFVVKNDVLTGHQRNREFPYVTFRHVDERMGRISVAGFHYSTHGRLPLDPNYDTNKLYAEKIGDWMREFGEGQDQIATGAGDFNMLDMIKRQDWAFGDEFTSMGDELDKYPNTGHGPIDGFVSYDGDRRVKAKKFEVFSDNRLRLFTDHYLIRGTWQIRHLKV